MNQTCGRLLNSGFQAAERHHSISQKRVKSQLPRRESERRNHPLARHSDILSAIETRISLLAMTFMKYVDLKLCFFIPGKVIDEINKLLHIVDTSQNISRVHDLLQELRDISSMAMEHFEEKIAPRLKAQLSNRCTPFTAITPAGKVTVRGFSPHFYKSPFRTQNNDEVEKLQQSLKQLSEQHRKDVVDLKKSITSLSLVVKEQRTRLAEHKERIRMLESGSNLVYDKSDDVGTADDAVVTSDSCPVARRTRSKRKTSATDCPVAKRHK